MNGIITVNDESELESHHDIKSEFIHDVQEGLSKSKKQIQSKYFYDDQGCELFNQITRHPDYYLTQCEIEILNTYKKQLAELITSPFNLIELGPGEGIKTQILMEAFLKEACCFRYIPIDISKNYLKSFIMQYKQRLPALQITPIHSDFFRGIEWLKKNSISRNLVLFLGSSIGNFDPSDTIHFLQHLSGSLNDGDYVLLGFDLRKDINILLRAYNDNNGITREFNLNMLRRINRELGANFDINKFYHYATYNVYSGAMESYIVSLEQQMIYIAALEKSYAFESIEPIHVEYSHKYTLVQIESFAQASGFEVIQHFIDSKDYFVDALWQVKKKKHVD